MLTLLKYSPKQSVVTIWSQVEDKLECVRNVAAEAHEEAVRAVQSGQEGGYLVEVVQEDVTQLTSAHSLSDIFRTGHSH